MVRLADLGGGAASIDTKYLIVRRQNR
jgi:hypothetical protein